MYYDLIFPYRISANAGLGYDRETHEDAEVYLRTALNQCKGKPITENKYKGFHESQRLALAKTMGLKPEWITCITPEEYGANADEEED